MMEIGQVYRESNGSLWLAVSQTMVVSFIEGRLVEKPATDGIATRKLSVGEIIEVWCISLADLDALSLEYLDPVSHRSTNTRNRSKSKLSPKEAIEETRSRLLHRLSFDL